MPDETNRQEDYQLIPLAEAAKNSGVPLETLLSAVKATPQRMWGIKVKKMVRGKEIEVWHTAPAEVQRFKLHWRKHQPVKNS